MNDLDTLRPEVQAAMRELREALRVQGVGSHGPQFTIISAELRRLAKENRILEIKNRGTLANNLCSDHRDKQAGRPCLVCLLEHAEAELAALKARIAMTPACDVFTDAKVYCCVPRDWVGKLVRLLVEE